MPMTKEQRRADRVARQARARKAAADLLGDLLPSDDFQIDYDAKVSLPPKGGDNGAWVDVRIWVRP